MKRRKCQIMASSDERQPILFSCKTIDKQGNLCANVLTESDRFCNDCGSPNKHYQPGAPKRPKLAQTAQQVPQSVGRGRGILGLSDRDRDLVLKQRESMVRSQHSPESSIAAPKSQDKHSNVDDSARTDDASSTSVQGSAKTDVSKSTSVEESSKTDVAGSNSVGETYKTDDAGSNSVGDSAKTDDARSVQEARSDLPASVGLKEVSDDVQKELADAMKTEDEQNHQSTVSGAYRDNKMVFGMSDDLPVPPPCKPKAGENDNRSESKRQSPEGEKPKPDENSQKRSLEQNKNPVKQEILDPGEVKRLKAEVEMQLNSNENASDKSGEASEKDEKTDSGTNLKTNSSDDKNESSRKVDVTATSEQSTKEKSSGKADLNGNDNTTDSPKPRKADASSQASNTGTQPHNGQDYFGMNSASGTGQVYQKPDEPPVYVKGQTQNQRETRSTAKNAQSSGKPVMVHFEMIASPSFKMTTKASDVYIAFGPKVLGGWNNYINGPMKSIRSTADGFVLYQYDVPVPYNLIKNDNSIEYKYVVCRSEKQKYKYERITRKTSYSDKIPNRQLKVPQADVSAGEWKQYDGIMAEQISWQSKGKKFLKGEKSPDTLAEFQAAVRMMLPNWEGFSTTAGENRLVEAEEILSQVDQVMFCVQKRITSEGMDDSMVKKILKNYISPRLEVMHKVNHGTESEEQAMMRLVSAIAVAHIIVKYGMYDADMRKYSEHICRSLLLREDLADFNALESYFPKTKDSLHEMLKNLIEKGFCRKDYSEAMWVLVVPLYHLLLSEEPCELISADFKTNSKWWGTDGIVDAIKAFQQRHYPFDNDITEYQRCLEPLYKHDPLLPRTLMAIVTYKKMTEENMSLFTPEAVLANIHYALVTDKYPHTMDTSELHKKLYLLRYILLERRANVIGDLTQQDALTTERDLAIFHAKIATNVLAKLKPHVDFLRDYQVFTIQVGIISHCLQNFEEAQKKLDKDKEYDVTQLHKLINQVSDHVDNFLNRVLGGSPVRFCHYGSSYTTLSDTRELDVFTELMSSEMGPEELGNIWKGRLMNFLRQRYCQLYPMPKMEIYCNTNFSKVHADVEKFFSDMAFDAIEDYCKESKNDLSTLFSRIGAGDGSKIKQILSQVFSRMWPKDESPEEILNLVLTWPAFVRYLDLLHGKQSSVVILSEVLQQNIQIALSVFTDMVQSLSSGKVTVRRLEYLRVTSDSILNVQRAIDRTTPGQNEDASSSGLPGINSAQVLLKVLEWRKQELVQFNIIKKNLAIFAGMCQMIEPACSDEELKALDKKLNHSVDDLFISNICKPQQYTQQTATERTYHPNINFFKVDQEILTCAENLSRYKENYTFMQLWKKFGKNKQSASFEEIVEQVWNPTLREFKTIYNGLKTGSITFQQINLYYRNLDNDNDLKKEYMDMAKAEDHDTKWIKQRVEQIRQFRALHRSQIGAKVMMGMKDKFKLTGNFDVLKLLTSSENHKSMQLKQMTPELVDAGNELKGIDDAKVNCLKVYLDCSELVVWLKESLEGPRQVKVLVDLAMITASGQGDMEVTKVKYLHAAVIGYTPLIYELKPDASFQMFLEQCKSVWRALETDKKLPDKLKTINQHREWLKKVKDSKGSMEVSAFAQVEMINKRGAYKIGNIKKANPKSTDDALSLTILPENGAENKEIQVYTFQQLNDLQSKLMLVAGKATEGKEEVDRFVEVFDGVTRLAALYIKLCNAGSILFKNWNCTFFCDPNRPVNTNIDFGLSEHILNGTKDVKVVDQISDICKFLEECLKDWIHHIEIKRQEHVSLNFYTTEQLVILRRELALLCKAGGQVPYSIFPMLSDVRPDCKENNLKDAMNGAYRDLKELERAGRADTTQDSASMGSDSEQSSDESQPDEAEQMRDLIDSLKESGYPERLCQKALKECGPNLQDAMMWCMEKMGEDDSSSDSSEDSKDRSDSLEDPSEQEVNLGISTTLQGLTSDLLQRITEGDNTLAGQLSDMWTSYLENVSTSVSDYLSVEHLGFVLTQLAGQVDETRNRPYPEYLQLDKPNLIVCPKAQLLHTILALFMHREGQDQPLPQRDEVLLCNHTTSAEQVELLLRRATSEDASHNGKLYCLADVGSLDYDVALKAEKFFEKHCKAKKTLRLIVICSQETEDRSHVVTFLEQHRVPYTPLYKLRDAQAYLKKHFIVDKQGTAPMLDPDRCSVRIIKSHRAGVGKTLKLRRLQAKLTKMLPGNRRRDNDLPLRVTIPLHRREVDASRVIQELFVYTPDPDRHTPRIFHIDIAHEVHEGVDHLLFDLLVLGSLMDRDGTVWRRCHDDLYVIETMPLLRREVSKQKADVDAVSYVHTVLQLLPALTCWSPEECLLLHQRDYDAMRTRYPDFAQNDHDQLMDDVQFRSTTFQRPYQYLERLATGANLREVEPRKVHGDHVSCLRTLISHCGVRDPSWAELCHFVHFLNLQLRDCELSDFCHPGAEEDLPNFRNFVVKFMIVMSKDFATRSLKISEETPGTTAKEDEDDDEDEDDEEGADNHLVQYQMKRQWETSPHPYIFFNADPHSESRHSMTFLGFNVTPTGDIIDPLTNNILERGVLPRNLQQPLVHNKVQLNENFDGLPRHEKIMRICAVFGMDMPHDPDPTYELTTDNVKKILAIHMRFRCEIPVVVMGETGCGKTRLVKFMCDLQKPPGLEMQNLVLMKVHGGTTDEEIMRKVERAGRLAITNRQNHPRVDTVLFFDEANTTDAIGLIKEILCDGTMRGQPLPAYSGLKFVVACNPYRKHSDEVIKTLEQAGLGYHIQADETKDKLGRIPMRQLVYRVHALPQSMLPLVWDFGQLNARIEELYIRQMVTRYINERHLPNLPHLVEVTSAVLSASQEFMKQQKDECSFVSLRDVDRVLQVMTWFYAHGDQLFPLMDMTDDEEDDEENEDEDEPNVPQVRLHPITRSLILALGACYHACLQKRKEYRQHVSRRFTGQMALPQGPNTIETEINRCQEVFLAQIDLPPNIARNQALKENLFMMVVCIELRIPLFLVGKPGSSKSLAKTIVTDAMQGDAAQHDLFRQLKLVHMISFQCSPLSTADGIIGTFRQCAQLQEDKDLTKFVAVVVLDEVGLAEDSPLMPLKTLHPLLEDGCAGEEEPAPHKKVACIAISNWALDPAKMNRGIHVQRGVPDIQELEDSAKGICQTDPVIQAHISTLVKPLADGYLKLYKKAIKEKREFFGLRDFYSLMKMVYGFSNYSKKTPSWYQLQHAILRNFGGLDRIDPVEVFSNTIHGVDKQAEKSPEDPDCTPSAMIRASVNGDGLTSESRYLLILTENYAALGILQQQLLDQQGTTVIFGSSFPKDQEYTQVCRNINKIKVCMEAGRTVVLLNLENLYESLYDALNQYYVKLGDARFVDLGLGTQRVKCEVHANFKLVVVAEKQVVYQKFPIPLINRLEKHFLAMSNMLTEAQISVADRLERWAETFTETRGGINIGHRQRAGPRIEDVFIGYSVDSTASVVMQVCHKMMDGRDDGDEQWADQVFEMSQDLLLQCATPDAVVRLRDTHKAYYDRYFTHQQHGSLQQLLHQQLAARDHRDGLFLQVTTHSKLLSNADVQDITRTLRLERGAVRVASLQAFDTEHQFTKTLRDFLQWRSSRPVPTDKLLVLQCDCGDQSGDLIASCRYILQDEYDQTTTDAVLTLTDAVLTHVVLVVQLPRVGRGSFVGFQGGRWLSYHIDDLHPQSDPLPSLKILKENSVSTLFEESLKQKQIPMEVDNVEQTDEDLMMSPESGIGPGGDAASMENSWVKLDEPGEEPMSEEDTDVDVETEMDFEGSPEGSGEPVEKILANEIAKASAEEHIDENDLLNVDRLIRKCIHGAAAMVKDYETDASRKTKRVEILLKLLDEKDAVSRDENLNMLSILDVINIRICRLLKDKEEQAMTGTMATSWLCNEAASVDSVNRAGTFRRALWQCLESKVTPMLAGLLAFSDRNRNLDLLVSHDQSHWLHQYWLRMLANQEATKLTYKDLQTVTQRLELSEFQVESSGCERTLFSAVLPFSWTLYNQINALMYQARTGKLRERPEDLVTRLGEQTALGRIIIDVVQETHAQEFIDMYLEDFVCMAYKPQSSDPHIEYQFVKDSIKNASAADKNRHRQDPEEEPDNLDEPQNQLQMTPPGIHQTYSVIQRRLHLCSQAFQVWPEGVARIRQAQEDPDDTPELFQSAENGMSLDVQILYVMVLELAPDFAQFDHEKNSKTYRKTWLGRVETFRPIIDRILKSIEEESRNYGRVCDKYQQKARHFWTRINVLYLFLQHICPPNEQNKGKKEMYNCRALWTVLKEDTDFKKEKSLTAVQKFLVTCNKVASQHFFSKKLKTCDRCKDTMNSPTKLPCKDIFCLRCVQEMKALGNRICPQCKKDFPADFKPKQIADKKEEILAHNQYKRRCNAFFMDVVSRYCFHGNAPPEPGVINMLLGYVTCEYKMAAAAEPEVAERHRTRTCPPTLFRDSIDPTPVVRSFLLQLLLQSNIDDVREHLDDYFKRCRDLFTDPQQILELCVLCVNCLEDYYHSRFTKLPSKPEKRLEFVVNHLSYYTGALNLDRLDMTRLDTLGCMRFCLGEVVEILHDELIQKAGDVGPRQQALLIIAKIACEQGQVTEKGITPTALYLLKQINARFGLNVLQQIGDTDHGRWVIPAVARPNEADVQPDRFVILGDGYKTLRNKLVEVMLGEPSEGMVQAYQAQRGKAAVKERDVLLAVYREVTQGLVRENADQRPSQQMLASVAKLCTQDLKLKHQDLLDKLLTNQLGQLTARPRPPGQEAELMELLLHYWLVLASAEGGNLLQPLVNLTKNPAAMRDAFLPTMPEDNLEEVRAALLEARQRGRGDENPVMYQCPNGHPYVIGNCGQPYYERNCNICGMTIGGRGHQAATGNTQMTAGVQNRTSPGHILGAADQRSTVAVPERLSPAATSTLRLLVHMAMYLGANHDPQAVSALIRSPAGLTPPATVTFLWHHLVKDFEVLGRAVGRSLEDCAVLVHSLLGNICGADVGGLGGIDHHLRTKEDRRNWEQRFAPVMAPILQDIDQRIQAATTLMVNDNRIGNNPLLRALYEVDTAATDEAATPAATPEVSILREPCVWRLRARITVEHLSQQFQETVGQAPAGRGQGAARNTPAQRLPVLGLFFEQEHHLRALRCLPGVMKLQRLLSQKLHRNIDGAEATKMTIKQFRDEHIQRHMRDEFRELLQNFIDAWKLVKGELGTFAVGGSVVPAQYCDRDITDSTSLALLLPATRGHGLCATALVYFLVDTHNSFMEEYARIRGISLPAGQATSSREVTLAHLVAFDPQRDLAPVLLAHCHYELTLGGATAQSTDFEGLEKAVEERFVRGRARVTAEVHPVVFRQELTTSTVLSQLDARLPQELSLTGGLTAQILADHRHLTDLNTSLATLDITLGFLVAVGGHDAITGDMPLSEFVSGTLKMSAGKLGRAGLGAAHRCQLRHVRALWLTLATERAKLLTDGQQDAFDSLDPAYKDPLPGALTEALTTHLQHRDPRDPRGGLSSGLFEYILLRLTAPKDKNADDYQDDRDYTLYYTLGEYLEERGYPTIPSLGDGRFPQEVLLKHSVSTWGLVLKAEREAR